jgi:hypothetical protein
MFRRTSSLLALALFVGLAAICHAASIDPSYAGSYEVTALGTIPGVPAWYGGLAFYNDSVLLVGGAGESSSGRIYAVGVIRDASGHITGFDSAPLASAAAPYIDGGIAWAPNGTLLFSEWPVNQVGEIPVGSAAPSGEWGQQPVYGNCGLWPQDTCGSSVGGLAIVPPGFSGAGLLKLTEYNDGLWLQRFLWPDPAPDGTYVISGAGGFPIDIGGNPEGIVYVPPGSPLFPNPTVLVVDYTYTPTASAVFAYQVDAYGDPIVSGQTDANGDPIAVPGSLFMTSTDGLEGAAVDPVTGDFLFTDYDTPGVDLVEATTPEPSCFLLFASGLLLFMGARKR